MPNRSAEHLPTPRSFPANLATALGIGALALVVGGMLVFGLKPALAAQHYFHPAVDSLWAGLLAQLVHFNTAHLILNLAGLLVLVALSGIIGKIAVLPLTLTASALAVCIGLRLETPPLDWYIGLSGALYGVWAWLALEIARQAPTKLIGFFALIGCVAVGAKAWLGTGSNGLLEGMPVAHAAHLYGYAGGLISAACLRFLAYYARRSQRTQ